MIKVWQKYTRQFTTPLLLWPALLVGLLLCFGLGHSAKAFSTSSVLSYFPFDSTTNDLMGGSSFTYSGGMSYPSGKFGSGAHPTSGAFLRYSSSAFLQTKMLYAGSGFAYSWWFKASSGFTTGAPTILYNPDTVYIAVYHDGLYFGFKTAGGNFPDYTYNGTAINDGNWHNIIITGTMGALSTTFHSYIDGTEVIGSWTSSPTHKDDAPKNISTISGYNVDGLPYSSAGNSIDDLAVFNVQLTPAEVGYLQTMSVNDAINYSPPVLPSAIIYAFGYPDMWSNPTIFQRNQTKYFNIFWNVCDDYASLNSVRLQANLNGAGYDAGVNLVQPKDTFFGAQQCKGSITTFHDNYTNFDTTTSGYANFYLTEYDASNTPIKVLISNTINYITATSSNYLVSSMPDPLMIDLGNLPQGTVATASTTKLMFFYDFAGLNVASSSVCLWDYNSATSTGFCNLAPLVASTTFGEIDIPTPHVNTHKNYQFYTISPNFNTIKSGLFGVNWSFTPVIETPLNCQDKSPALDHVCDFLGKPDIIGTSTFDYSDFGSHFVCAMTRASVITVAFFVQPNCSALNYFQDGFNNFQQTPPFNIFYQFTDTIESALASTTVQSTTTFAVPFVHNIGATNTIYMLPVISSSSVSNAIGTSNVSAIRVGVSYFIWLLGALIVALMIWKL